jgi:hypothetical protein
MKGVLIEIVFKVVLYGVFFCHYGRWKRQQIESGRESVTLEMKKIVIITALIVVGNLMMM